MMADFDVGVCTSAEKFVNDQSLDKAIRKVLGMFDDVENLSAEQRDGMVNFICSEDVLLVLPTGFEKSLLFQLIPGLCVELHNLGYSHYPKSPTVIVIWPLNTQIECYNVHEGIEAFRDFVHLTVQSMLSILICDKNLRTVLANSSNNIRTWRHNTECKQATCSR